MIMEEVLAYQIWLKLPDDTRAILAKLFDIRKTGRVVVEYRAEGAVMTSDGYTPDDLRAISIEKMQHILGDTEDNDFYALIEIIIENIGAIVKGDFKYRPTTTKKKDETKIKEGDRVMIPGAIEVDGKLGDAFAKVLKISKKLGKLTLEFENPGIAEALKDFMYTIADVEKAPENDVSSNLLGAPMTQDLSQSQK